MILAAIMSGLQLSGLQLPALCLVVSGFMSASMGTGEHTWDAIAAVAGRRRGDHAS